MRQNVLMSVVLGISVMAAHAQEKLVMDGSTTVGPIAKAFAETYMRQNPGVNITVSESGSGNGAKALLNGTCDIANLSRHLKESEKKAMSEKGVRPVAHVVAFDALPVIVHPSNRVKGLTLDQIRDIYTGKITNWKEVGGGDQRIVVISRDTNSGTLRPSRSWCSAMTRRSSPAPSTRAATAACASGCR
jgi:phosphate transport system substrate-binding protein